MAKHVAVAIAGLVFLLTVSPVEAATFAELKAQGYKVSKITQNRAGLGGWYLTKGGERYFCKVNSRQKILINKTTMMQLKRSGKLSGIKIDIAAYESRLGRKLDRAKMVTASALKSGRVPPHYVESCSNFGV